MRNSKTLLHQTEYRQTKIDIPLEKETLWISKSKDNNSFIKEHSVSIKNTFVKEISRGEC